MPETQESDADRKAKIAEFMKNNPGRKLASGGTAHGEVKEPTPEAAPEPERIIAPKTFDAIPYSQGNLDACLIVMSMADIADYTEYASELYDIKQDEKGKKIPIDPSQTWQREVKHKRADNEIAPYLQKELHFFPSLILVPVDESVTIENGKLTAPAASLAVLDGQHRKAGIESLLVDCGPNSDFGKEQISCVVITSPLSIDDRQQIFADINRSAKVVSKALNILFDHRDTFAQISHAVCKELGDVVDLARTSPNKSSNHVCSLSNIYNLTVNFAAQDHKHPASSGLREIDPQTHETLQEADVLAAVVNMIRNIPSFERLKANHDKFGMAKDAYICFSSTIFQAMGTAIRSISLQVKGKDLVDVAGKLVANTKWDNANPVWAPLFDSNGKVAVSAPNVAKASAILTQLWVNQLAEMQG